MLKGPHQAKHLLNSSAKFCIERVKQYDWENYVAGLCIDQPTLRRTVFSLRAFNVELALIRDVTTNSDRAKVRFYFWSKLIDEILARNKSVAGADGDKDAAYFKHTPIAKEMLDLFRMVDVDENMEGLLKDLVGARLSSKVLGYKLFENLDELETYCKKSNSSFYQLAWRIYMQAHSDSNCDDNLRLSLTNISHDVGIAHGLSNVIRGIRYNSTKNCCYIPQDILDGHGLTRGDLVTGKLNGERLRPVVESLACRTETLLTQAYRRHSDIPNYYRQLFLPRVAITANLKLLKKCNYNICDPKVDRRNNWLPLSMKMSSVYFRAAI